MIKYFLIGLFIGGVLGFTIASLMSVASEDDDIDDT